MRKALYVALALAAFTVLARPASAQVVFNPRTVEYVVSADHAATLSDGTPKVARYEIRFFAPDAVAPMSTGDLGKPAPGADGRVTQDISTLPALIGLPIGGNYIARVAAIGPTGEGVSQPSNPFDIATAPAPATDVRLGR